MVGRQLEQDMIRERLLLSGVRLLTLIGPGGVGKTRLALGAADDMADRFADGAVFVDLSPVTDQQAVLPAVAEALSWRQGSSKSIGETVEHALADSELLLVLDNFEHLIIAAPEITRLLEACPGVYVLMTSRQPTGLRWEHTLSVEPLTVPAEHEDRLADLRHVASIALLIERAQAVRPGFDLTAENASSLVSICRALTDCRWRWSLALCACA